MKLSEIKQIEELKQRAREGKEIIMSVTVEINVDINRMSADYVTTGAKFCESDGDFELKVELDKPKISPFGFTNPASFADLVVKGGNPLMTYNVMLNEDPNFMTVTVVQDSKVIADIISSLGLQGSTITVASLALTTYELMRSKGEDEK